MHVLFMNTGVQVVCQPITTGTGWTTAQIGDGWQRCFLHNGADEKRTQLRYVQWQVTSRGLLFLAVDTTCGDPSKGYFCDADSLTGDFEVRITNLAGADGSMLEGMPEIAITIRPPSIASGDVKRVDLVVDFGNSRTGALLIEPSSERAETPLMEPFELCNRYHLSNWDDDGVFQKQFSARWFPSRTQWCTTPYLEPERVDSKQYVDAPPGRFGRRPPPPQEVDVEYFPRLFQELSPCRMGTEVADITQLMKTSGDIRSGVSSPKRYLWADDDSWLEGAKWLMSDPSDRDGTGNFANSLKAPLFKLIDSQDDDVLKLPDRDSDELSPEERRWSSPIDPRYPPRNLMVAAIYELLSQAYCYINSQAYRDAVGDGDRPREIRSLTMTYPSGMIFDERDRLKKQVEKAVQLFHTTAGRMQSTCPSVSMAIDEASAVHLTYLWSELQLLDRDARLWFSLLSRERELQPAAAEAEAEPQEQEPETRRKPRGRSGRGRSSRRARSTPATDSVAESVRIACIDIGGGTTDLMIAKYDLDSGMVDSISGEVLHRDGISVAGDQLVKRLLEVIIIPEFADVTGMDPDMVKLLFGPNQPKNRGFRGERISWVNRLFVPLAQAYLRCAVDDDTTLEIDHLDPQRNLDDVVSSLQEVIEDEYGPGTANVVNQRLDLRYEPLDFEDVVHEVFNDLLFDLCGRIADHDADIVLLAGQPSKLKYIQELVRLYLPLPASRIIPMHNYYAGTWYPYQDEQGREPGIIVDPKSAVVVGAAIESMMSRGGLGQFQFSMNEQRAASGEVSNENSYYWGQITEGSSKIKGHHVLFSPGEEKDKATFPVIAQRILIGRRISSDPKSEASPVWVLKIPKEYQDGPIRLEVTVRRKLATDSREESIELANITGTVSGEEVDLGRNVLFQWRTLADEEFYLDTGALDNIEFE